MSDLIPSSLFQRLHEFRAATYFNDRGPQATAIRADLARIADEKVRQGAMDRFHILMVCMSVMRMDPGNYQRAVGKAFDQLVTFLETSGQPVPIPSAVPSVHETPLA